ncbi:S41 family peptidase [Oceanivirga salmonicida]|uniref:S41 family peptidase n=1 Tax=Oceanivirga salmonicida TaxID=1769291 RepID=UPI0012E295CA|nr:S41 family peptidase [Oceanivirga salmonicida]
MKKNIFYVFVGIILSFLILFIINFIKIYNNHTPNKNANIDSLYLQEIKRTVNIVERNYVLDEKIDKTKLYTFALKGIVDSLGDKYSEFLSEEDLKRDVNELNSKYVGLGFEASKKVGKYFEILTVYLDSPAFKAGLIANDKIIEINGKDTKQMSSKETISLIRGEKGSKIDLKVSRDGKTINITAIREEIKSKIIDSKIFDKNIGYISIASFPKNIGNEFKMVLNDLKEKGINKLILDLRGNTGGEIGEVMPIASILLGDDKKFLFKVAHKSTKDDIYEKNEKQLFDGQIIVLANKFTASASEILISILKDYNRATIIGENTFGKGITQRFYYLDSGNIVKLTAGKYYTFSENEIDKVGIKPDIEIEMDNLVAKTAYINESDSENMKRMSIIKDVLTKQYGEKKAKEIAKNGDVQLKKAFEIFNKK